MTGSAGRATIALLTSLTIALSSGCGRSGSDDPAVAGTSVVGSTTSTTVSQTVTTEAPPVTQLTYVVQPGDTLSVIAERFGITTEELADFNAVSDADTIKVGQELTIPPAGAETTTTGG